MLLYGGVGSGIVDEATRIGLAALGAVKEAVLVVDAAVPHTLWVVLRRGVFDADLGGVGVVIDTGTP